MFRNQFIKFVSKVLILLLLLVIIDQVVGAILKRLYFKQIAGLNYRTTYSIDSTQADILVFGSSRANHHYIPEIFEDSLKMSFYNTGRDGNTLLYSFAVFKSIINRYTPQIIILDINTDDLYYNKESYDRLSSLLPYYYEHPEIQGIINLRSPYEKYKLLSAVYPYNSCLLTILIGNMEFNKKRKSDRKGYVPLFGNIERVQPSKENPIVNKEFDNNRIKALQEIIYECDNQNVKLYIVFSPYYMSKIVENETLKKVTKLTLNQKVTCYNFVNDMRFNGNAKYFKDASHLNNEGAILFSSILASCIKKQNFQKNVVAENKQSISIE